jgi:hypothetical protein
VIRLKAKSSITKRVNDEAKAWKESKDTIAMSNEDSQESKIDVAKNPV